MEWLRVFSVSLYFAMVKIPVWWVLICIIMNNNYFVRVIGRERRRSQSSKRKEKVHRDVSRRGKDYHSIYLFDLLHCLRGCGLPRPALQWNIVYEWTQNWLDFIIDTIVFMTLFLRSNQEPMKKCWVGVITLLQQILFLAGDRMATRGFMEERSYESEASKEESFNPKKDDFESGVTKVFYEKKSVYMKASSDFLASLSQTRGR